MKLKFNTINHNGFPRKKEKLTVYLRIDNWNDYGYHTLYEIVLFDENAIKHDLGYVKIANFGQTMEARLNLPEQFEVLDNRFFSLGQSTEYYEEIQKLHPYVKGLFLSGLHDIVYEERLQTRAILEDVTSISLLRDTSWTSVQGQYKRILNGDATLSEYHFKYETFQTDKEAGYSLKFDVLPESNPPNNIHVLI